ncbi:MAG: ArsR family transcriptional regulator [Halodesulfurarchaeum sp.]
MIVFADAASESPAERLWDLPPSAKLVYRVLEDESPLTQAEIGERSRLTRRTTRHAISLLREAELVDSEPYPPDARKRLYRPITVGEDR